MNTTPHIEHIASTQTATSDAGRPFIVDWHWGEDEDGFHLLGCSFEPLSVDGEAMPQMHLTLSTLLDAAADCDWVVSKDGRGYILYFCGVPIATLFVSDVPRSHHRRPCFAPTSDFRPCDEPAEAYVADLRSSGKVA